MNFAPNLTKSCCFLIFYAIGFLVGTDIALYFLNFLAYVAQVSYRLVSYKKSLCILSIQNAEQRRLYANFQLCVASRPYFFRLPKGCFVENF